MNIANIKKFLMVHNSGTFLKYQAEEQGLTDNDLDYMCSKRYIRHIQDDQYGVLDAGSKFAFEKD